METMDTFSILLYSWLGLALANIIFNIIAQLFCRAQSDSDKGSSNIFTAILSLLSGLCIAVLISMAFAQDNQVLLVLNGKNLGTLVFSIFMMLAFLAIGTAAASYGGDYFARAVLFFIKTVVSKQFRIEHKMTTMQKIQTAFALVGILATFLYYFEYAEFEMTVKSIILWMYFPIFGICLGMAFYLPIYMVVNAQSISQKIQNEQKIRDENRKLP
ncbi:MAG: hypothetical protein LBQ79_07020 [Deltaproteobacteria bacterium]|nr:hypothetical protein [Deltaproteobacteria bacterium]